MKEQNKTPEKELSKRDTRNLPDAEFKTLVIRMLHELRGRVEELSRPSIKRWETKPKIETFLKNSQNEEYTN